MESILALDPGKTTGYCFATYDKPKLWLLPGQYAFTLRELYTMLTKMPSWTHVVYEDFTYRNASRSGLDLTPVKMIGIIELFADDPRPVQSCHKQTASEGKLFFSDDRLKKLELYVKGLKHGMDATRHLLHFLEFKSNIVPMRVTDVQLDTSGWTLDTYYSDRKLRLTP